MNNSNHWDSLAASLGAEIPPEAEPSAEPKQAARPPAASRPAPSTPKKAAPPKSSTDWGQLASELGLTPTQTPPVQSQPAQAPPTQARQAEPPARAASPPREVPRERGPESRGRDRNRGRERDRDRDRDRPRREPQLRDEHRRVPPAGEVPVAREQDEPIDEPDFIFDEDPLAEILKAEAAESQQAAGAAEQSQDERAPRKRRRRRRGGRRSKRDRVAGEESPRGPTGESSETTELRFESSVDDFEAAEHDEFHALDEGRAAPEASAESPPGEESERKGRSKRRRRRGRGGRGERGPETKGEVSRTPAREAAAEDDDHPEEDLTPLENDEALGGDSLGEDEEADAVGDKNSHRAIPAWEEAIGYIVAVNMETRAKNPKAGQPRGRGRGRSSGRGAPRGGNGRRN